jgi:hypothetical protein
VNRHGEKSTIDDEEEARNMTMVSPHLERIDEQSDGKQEGQGEIRETPQRVHSTRRRNRTTKQEREQWKEQ